MRPEVGNRRLLKLAKFLRNLPKKRFNYRSWTGYDWKGKQDLSCGTTGCALGWAATMPAFRRLGMRLERARQGGGYVVLKDQDTETSFDVAEIVFGITSSESEYLFCPQTEDEFKATPKQVAKKIADFVAKRKKKSSAVAT